MEAVEAMATYDICCPVCHKSHITCTEESSGTVSVRCWNCKHYIVYDLDKRRAFMSKAISSKGPKVIKMPMLKTNDDDQANIEDEDLDKVMDANVITIEHKCKNRNSKDAQNPKDTKRNKDSKDTKDTEKKGCKGGKQTLKRPEDTPPNSTVDDP